MGSWEFVMIFMLVLIGAGVTNILHGVGRLLLERERVRFSWVHGVWLTVLAFTYISVWFSFYSEQGMAYNFWEFIGFFLSFGLLHLLTVLSFPDFTVAGRLDLREHFMRHHRPYFGVWTLVWLSGLASTVVTGNGLAWRAEAIWPCVYSILSISGVLWRSERVHARLALAIVAAILLQIVGS